ncbi:tautomerase family protein [Klebsiella variicola subsp. variicola]|nr:tautomerase family protein [Klebsiella variicola subsp. variicola]
MVIDDTGLGLTRSRDLVVVRVYTSPAQRGAEATLLRPVAGGAGGALRGLSGDDVMVSIISNQKGDWSFGRGVAQYLTGDL